MKTHVEQRLNAAWRNAAGILAMGWLSACGQGVDPTPGDDDAGTANSAGAAASGASSGGKSGAGGSASGGAGRSATGGLKNAIQRFLKKSGSAAGTIDAHSKATGKLSDWSDWTAPTLN